jgi:hypothetical protein
VNVFFYFKVLRRRALVGRLSASREALNVFCLFRVPKYREAERWGVYPWYDLEQSGTSLNDDVIKIYFEVFRDDENNQVLHISQIFCNSV